LKRLLLIYSFAFFSLHSVAQLPGFVLTGNPQSATGASWTYRDTINSIMYDLEGILFVPQLSMPPMPAVIINHGTGGNSNGYSRNMAMNMVQWGMVCIATNLCHASGVPIGSPGDTSFANWGASTNNYLRDMKCWDILASLGYVDTNCIMSFGHSRGAFTTTGLVASYPDKFSCAGHTAGGTTMQTGTSVPHTSLAAQVTCPYIIHHGDSDSVVPVAMDTLLNSVFNSTGIIHQFFIYPGLTHPQMSMDSLMLVRTQNWFLNYACGIVSINEESSPAKKDELIFHPNPFHSSTEIKNGTMFQGIAFLNIYNTHGSLVNEQNITSENTMITRERLSNGIYFVVVSDGEKEWRGKVVVE
jgi:dienelactone hydrolase